ncbi:MAG: amidohydrolase family protein [Actinomycetota bacterium]|nr:amidohydrolase family protein [Actinomycetota bacterium]
MAYAGDLRIVDADSHLMEWPGFLTDNADPSWREQMPPVGGGRSGLTLTDGDRDTAEREALVSMGDDLLRGPKWHAALGSVNRAERTTALDLLGFEHQVVYSSLCAPLFLLGDPELRYATYRAHNRAVAGFCADDDRLHGVALCDLDDMDRAMAELDVALELGLRSVWLPARAPGGRAPGHVDHDPFWARLAEAGVPFVLHVGSGPLGIGDEWLNNGQPAAAEMSGAEIIGSKDVMVVYQSVERFLSVLVLDGVLERHPGLRGGAIEIGAGWVPDMLRRLDHAVRIWSRSEPRLATFERLPSEQAGEQLRFTPYPFEDVGRLCVESDPRLYLFSSDYPHAEGGRDPLGRFTRSLDGQPAPTLDAFYHDNAATWLALA